MQNYNIYFYWVAGCLNWNKGANSQFIYFSPFGRNMNPLGRNVNPNGRNMNPNGRNVNPNGRNMNPNGRNMNPNGRNMNPLGETLLFLQESGKLFIEMPVFILLGIIKADNLCIVIIKNLCIGNVI